MTCRGLGHIKGTLRKHALPQVRERYFADSVYASIYVGHACVHAGTCLHSLFMKYTVYTSSRIWQACDSMMLDSLSAQAPRWLLSYLFHTALLVITCDSHLWPLFLVLLARTRSCYLPPSWWTFYLSHSHGHDFSYFWSLLPFDSYGRSACLSAQTCLLQCCSAYWALLHHCNVCTWTTQHHPWSAWLQIFSP